MEGRTLTHSLIRVLHDSPLAPVILDRRTRSYTQVIVQSGSSDLYGIAKQ